MLTGRMNIIFQDNEKKPQQIEVPNVKLQG